MKKLLAFLILLILILLTTLWFLFDRPEEVSVIHSPPRINDIPKIIFNEGDISELFYPAKYISDIDNELAELFIQIKSTSKIGIAIEDENSYSFIPKDKDWFGEDTLQIIVVDPQQLKDTAQIYISVLPVNDSPEIKNIPGETITEGGYFIPIDLNNFAADIDNEIFELSWSASGNKNLEVIITNDNFAHISPVDKNWFGEETIQFSLSDNYKSTVSTFTNFKITPINDTPKISQIPVQTYNEGEYIPEMDLWEWVSDVDNCNEELSIKLSGYNFLNIELKHDRYLSIEVPDENWFGEDEIFLKITDPGGLSAERKIKIIILSINDPPAISDIPQQSIIEDQFFAPINLNEFASDVEDDSTQLKWECSVNKNIFVTINEFNRAYVTSKEDWFGTDSVTFKVTDSEGLSAEKTTYFSIREKTFWERNVPGTLKTWAVTGADDFVSVALSPAEWGKDDFKQLGLIIGGTLVFSIFDQDIYREMFKHNSFHTNDFLKVGDYYGRVLTSQIVSASFALHGLIDNNEKTKLIALEILESYLITEVFTNFLKSAAGRARPYSNLGSYNFAPFSTTAGERRSFPSNHTALAFSLSTVLSSHVEDIYAKYLIYAPAFVTAAERIFNSNHWISDVFAGAMIGYSIAKFVVNRHNDNGTEINFGIDPKGGLRFQYIF